MKDRFDFRIPMFTSKGRFKEFQYLQLGDEIECTLCGHNGDPEQCIGLKDIRDVLAYEHDVVKDILDNIFVVRYETGKFYLNNVFDEYCPIKDFTFCRFEIIGNIHQNPELIEKGE